MFLCSICGKEFHTNGCAHTLLEISAHQDRLKEIEHLKEILGPWIKKLIRQELDRT